MCCLVSLYAQDLKWRTFARGVLKVESFLHVMTLAVLTCLALVLHSPNNMVFWQFYEPHSSPDALHGSAAPARQVVNAINFLLFIMMARVFGYGCVALTNASSILQWACCMRNWIDVLAMAFYAVTVVSHDYKSMSTMSAFLSLILWSKTLYYIQGIQPLASLVKV